MSDEMWLFDANGDGIVDQTGIDSSGDGVVDIWQLDEDQDGFVDDMAFDMDGDGRDDQHVVQDETVVLGDWDALFYAPVAQPQNVVDLDFPGWDDEPFASDPNLESILDLIGLPDPYAGLVDLTLVQGTGVYSTPPPVAPGIIY